MSVHLITGYAGKEHITSDDQASFNASVFGAGNYVFNKGNKLKAVMKSNTAIDIYDGDIMFAGRHIIVTDINTVYFDEGTEGMRRIDLVVAEYSKDERTEVENVVIKVIKGAEASRSAEAPEYDREKEMLLYTVNFYGFSMTGFQSEFEIIMSNYDYMRNMQYAITSKKFTLKKEDWQKDGAAINNQMYYRQTIYDEVDFPVFFEAPNPIFFIDPDYEGKNVEKMESYFAFIYKLNITKVANGYRYDFMSKTAIQTDLNIVVKGVL